MNGLTSAAARLVDVVQSILSPCSHIFPDPEQIMPSQRWKARFDKRQNTVWSLEGVCFFPDTIVPAQPFSHDQQPVTDSKIAHKKRVS
jgi:hypothetical protein